MTDNEKKLRRALEWLINLHEDAINASDKSYCGEFCPVRDKQTDFCPAEYVVEHFNPDFDTYERDYQKCMELQVEYYTENA